MVDGLSDIAQPEKVSFTAYGTKGTLSLLNWNRLQAGGIGQPLEDIAVEETLRLHELVSNVVRAIDGEEATVFDFQVGYVLLSKCA